MPKRNNDDKILEKVDEGRRGFVKRVLGASFAVPIIATFSIEALTSSTAGAISFSNQTQNGNQDPALFGNQYDQDYLFKSFFNG